MFVGRCGCGCGCVRTCVCVCLNIVLRLSPPRLLASFRGVATPLLLRFDETLLLWKRALNLSTRDIIFTSIKAQVRTSALSSDSQHTSNRTLTSLSILWQLSHPRFRDWSVKAQEVARQQVEDSGDLTYYNAVRHKFELQVG